MNSHVPLFSAHRLKQLHRWLALMLQLMAACVFEAWFANTPLSDEIRARVKRLRLAVLAFFVVQALAQTRRNPLRHHAHAHPGFERRHTRARVFHQLVGARLRKMTRGTTGEIIAALVALIANAKTEIARLVRRFTHGLTRRVTRIPPTPPVELFALSFATPAPSAADSS